MEHRLTELEIKLSLAEDQIDALNRTAYRQEQQLVLLQQQLRHLHRQVLSASEPDEPRSLRDEIPPHY